MQNFTRFPRGDFGLVPKGVGNDNDLVLFFLFWGVFRALFILSSHAALHVAYVVVVNTK